MDLNAARAVATRTTSSTPMIISRAFLACFLCWYCALAEDNGLRELGTRIDAAIANGNAAEAIAILSDALKQKPDWREGWWRLGNVLYQADRYAQARPAFERLTSL